MALDLHFEFDLDEAKLISTKAHLTQKEIKQIMRRALKRVLTQARREIITQISIQTGVKKSIASRYIGFWHLSSTGRISGRVGVLLGKRILAKAFPSKQTSKGVKVRLGRKTIFFENAFKVDTKNLKDHVLERVDRSRLPIQIVEGIYPNISKTSFEVIANKSEKSLVKEVSYQIELLFNRLAKKNL